MLDIKKILVLAPHTDDGELGCGATIAKSIAAGYEVLYAGFSTCAESLSTGVPSNTLAHECQAATKVLGLKKEQVVLFDFKVREFAANRQKILETMVQLNKSYRPETVLLPAQNDVHQDHQTIYAEGRRAFKNCTLLGYELPWNNTGFQPTYFEQLTMENLRQKYKALAEYGSQSHRGYMKESFIQSLAIVRGLQCNTEFAEAFEVYKIISY